MNDPNMNLANGYFNMIEYNGTPGNGKQYETTETNDHSLLYRFWA